MSQNSNRKRVRIEGYIDIKGAAKILGVSSTRVRVFVNTGRIIEYYIEGGYGLFFSIEELEKFREIPRPHGVWLDDE